MNNQKQDKRPYFFNLKEDKSSAIVRLLHTSPETIESINTHRVKLGDKFVRVKCLGEADCPLCEEGEPDKRIYIHLFDYTDNIEKVWDRTDKILPQLEKLFTAWHPLNSAVVKITRIGNEFPKYFVEPQNPLGYADVDSNLIDKPVAKRFSFSRNADELKIFMETGNFPERKEYIPKNEYNKMNESEKESFKVSSVATAQTVSDAQLLDSAQSDVDNDFSDLPF